MIYGSTTQSRDDFWYQGGGGSFAGAAEGSSPHSASSEVSASIVEEPVPEPADRSVTMRLTLPASCHVKLALEDPSGASILTVLDADLDAGEHTVRVDPVGVSTGDHGYRLQACGDALRGVVTIRP